MVHRKLVEISMSRKCIMEEEWNSRKYQFSVMMVTSHKVTRTFKEFNQLETYLSMNKEYAQLLKDGPSSLGNESNLAKSLGRREDRFISLIVTLEAFLQKLADDHRLLRDAKFLDFLQIPSDRREWLGRQLDDLE